MKMVLFLSLNKRKSMNRDKATSLLLLRFLGRLIALYVVFSKIDKEAGDLKTM